jgi:hypothetical protein
MRCGLSSFSVSTGNRTSGGSLRRPLHERLARYDLKFAPSIRELWLEYEAQESVESRWVKVMDRVMPFIINLATKGLIGKSSR